MVNWYAMREFKSASIQIFSCIHIGILWCQRVLKLAHHSWYEILHIWIKVTFPSQHSFVILSPCLLFNCWVTLTACPNSLTVSNLYFLFLHCSTTSAGHAASVQEGTPHFTNDDLLSFFSCFSFCLCILQKVHVNNPIIILHWQLQQESIGHLIFPTHSIVFPTISNYYIWKANQSEIGLILNQSSVYVCVCTDQASAL